MKASLHFYTDAFIFSVNQFDSYHENFAPFVLLEPIESNSWFFRAKNLLIRVIYYTSPLRGQTWHFSFFGAIKSLSRSHTPPRPGRAAINSYQSHAVECMRELSQTKEAMTYTNTRSPVTMRTQLTWTNTTKLPFGYGRCILVPELNISLHPSPPLGHPH